ncbi:unnamed protein product [Pylaiella littoralis]
MASIGGKQAAFGAEKQSDRVVKKGSGSKEVGGRSSGSSGGGSSVDKRRTHVPAMIDLSSPSWDDDPFLDAAEQQNAGKANGSASTSSISTSSTGRKSKKKIANSNISSTGSSGTAAMAAGRRRPAAPLTSISALFGGGVRGNRENRTGSAAAPSKPRAGTKRPRTTPSTSQSKMKPPLPPAATAAAAAASFFAGGRENSNTQRNRTRYRQPGAVGAAAAAVGGAGAGEGRDADGLAGGGRGQGGRVEDQLWPDKHRPRDVSGLAVHTKKVDEVRHWMTLALNAGWQGGDGACRLLALVGPPGSAKSTMVRLLAQDMDVELAEWQDTSGQGGPTYRPIADGPALGGERPRHELGSSYQSAIDSFEEFMKRSSYRSLSILAVKPTKAGGGGNQPGGGGGGRGASGSSSSSSKRQRVVLIEELPEVYGEEKKARLRRLIAECARSSPCPVIICWSQASESSSYQSRLEQVLSRETLRMPGVQITTCNPINATLLRQHLNGVLALEGVSDPKGSLVQSAITTCAGVSVSRTRTRTHAGDIRHALLNLQMSVGGSSLSSAALGQHNGVRKPKRAGREKRAAGNAGGGGKGVSASSAAGKGAGTGMRDTFLTQFHALGKLLYAKRGPPGGGAGDEEGRGPLTFVPEEVLSQGGMELDWALEFLQYHCVDFFTDESDLSQGLGFFSDADVFASRMFDSSRGYDGGGEQGVFPQRYAESIASRATAVSNKQPAKSRMRAFGAPKSFEMRRSQKEAAGALRRFVMDAWDASGGDADALWASSRHLKEAVDTDLLPTARLITGEWEAEAALRSLLHRFMQGREKEPPSQQQQQQQQSRTGASEEMGLFLAGGGVASAPPPLAAGTGGRGGKGRGGALVGGNASGVGLDSMAACSGEGGGEDEDDEIGDF